MVVITIGDILGIMLIATFIIGYLVWVFIDIIRTKTQKKKKREGVAYD